MIEITAKSSTSEKPARRREGEAESLSRWKIMSPDKQPVCHEPPVDGRGALLRRGMGGQKCVLGEVIGLGGTLLRRMARKETARDRQLVKQLHWSDPGCGESSRPCNSRRAGHVTLAPSRHCGSADGIGYFSGVQVIEESAAPRWERRDTPIANGVSGVSGSGPLIIPLSEAVRRFVRSGDSVAMEGFTHLIPFAAGHEIIRQGLKDLTLIRMTPDLIYDQLIGMGCARRLIFSWGGNPGVGSLHRLRDAIERGFPEPLEIEEHTHAAMAVAYQAGAANLPFGVLRGYVGVDLPKVNGAIRSVRCPYSGQVLATVPALRPDVAIIHAQRADRAGNVLIEGVTGIQKECAFAAQRTVVTVEELVDDLRPGSVNAVVLPAWTVSAIAVTPRGAFPSYAHGYYERSNAFYIAWDAISRDRATFRQWIENNVLQPVEGDRL